MNTGLLTYLIIFLVDQTESQVVSRSPDDITAEYLTVLPTSVDTSSQRLNPSVLLVAAQCPLGAQIVTQWDVGRYHDIATVKVAGTDAQIYAKLFSGKLRMHVDRTTCGITTVQRTLWATEDLHTIQLYEVTSQQAVVGYLPYTINVYTYIGDTTHVKQT